jgi:MFS family permease
LSWSFLHLPAFWVLQASNVVFAVGYALPQTYIPSYASTLHLSNTTGTIMLTLFGGFSVVGSMVLGLFNDHFQVSTCIFVSAIGSAFSIFVFWGFSHQAALLAVFAVTYGLFAGSYSSTWSGVLIEMKRLDPNVETGLIYGLLSGGRGIGFVISGPVSSMLLNAKVGNGKASGYGGEYGSMILFTGISALLGGCGFAQKWLRQGRA